MTRRFCDHAPDMAPDGTVHFVNPDRPHDYIEVRAEEDGSISIRSSGGGLEITPHVSNHESLLRCISVKVAKR